MWNVEDNWVLNAFDCTKSVMFVRKCININFHGKVILARYTRYKLWRTGIWVTDGGADITDLYDDTKRGISVSGRLLSDS